MIAHALANDQEREWHLDPPGSASETRRHISLQNVVALQRCQLVFATHSKGWKKRLKILSRSTFAIKSYLYQKLEFKISIHVLVVGSIKSIEKILMNALALLRLSINPKFEPRVFIKTCELAAVWSTLVPAAVEGISFVLRFLETETFRIGAFYVLSPCHFKTQYGHSIAYFKDVTLFSVLQTSLQISLTSICQFPDQPLHRMLWRLMYPSILTLWSL